MVTHTSSAGNRIVHYILTHNVCISKISLPVVGHSDLFIDQSWGWHNQVLAVPALSINFKLTVLPGIVKQDIKVFAVAFQNQKVRFPLAPELDLKCSAYNSERSPGRQYFYIRHAVECIFFFNQWSNDDVLFPESFTKRYTLRKGKTMVVVRRENKW